ncbi:MAG: hypothetical protein U0930_13925 [Pirellulales bacterium]
MSESSTNWAGIGFVDDQHVSVGTLDVDLLATGWQSGLARSLNIELVECAASARASFDVQAVSIRLQSKLPQTIGFSFPEAARVSNTSRKTAVQR